MISQADIIKTLVNRNCTDESVMMTALSPDCTPPKLLEKLTEAERFDLALDVSMKLGLDVIPLWRTWAMRCLQNYNFQAARDKFRHCFVRFRQPGGRTSPFQNKLLTDILRQLSKMSDTKLTLLEEIELIKRRKLHEQNIDSGREKSILFRARIYDECCHYLNEYGNTNDWIRFYARNSLWDKAVEALLSIDLSKAVDDKFFLADLVLYSTSRGQLSALIKAFTDLDPLVVRSAKYFKVIYTFCLRNRRYNLLYYVQASIRDYIASASTQIEHAFLRKPVSSYRELNHRIGSLIQASKDYREYLERVKVQPQPEESFLSSMPAEKVENLIRLIEMQIEITRNFAINEVTGCISTINLDDTSKEASAGPSDDGMDLNFPVTLFDNDERCKTFLAALVLIYFDLSCSTYFSKSGLDLTNKLIDDHGLDKVKVFKTAMRVIIEDESCDIMENASLLLERIKEDYATNYRRPPSSPLPPPILGGASGNLSPARDEGQPSLALPARQRQKRPSLQVQQLTPPPPQPGKAIAASISPRLRRSQTSDKAFSTGAGSASSSASATLSANNASERDKELIAEGSRSICDEVVRDSIGSCSEPDYKMELAKLLSNEAKIELYIEHGKLSNAQRLACTLNRPDYVSRIIEEATKLNQNHVKTVCQLWLAKHETRNSIR